jgi:hypothetical protein
MFIGSVLIYFLMPGLLDVCGTNPLTLRKFLHEELRASSEFENVHGWGPTLIDDGYDARIQFTCASPVSFKSGSEGNSPNEQALSRTLSSVAELLPDDARSDASRLECRADKSSGEAAQLIHVKGSNVYVFAKFHPSAF